MKKNYLIIFIAFFFLAACGSSPKHAKSSKHAKHNSTYAEILDPDQASLEDIIYESLGHKRGSGVRYTHSLGTQSGKHDIPITYNDAVQKWIDYFTGKGRPHFTRYLSRSGRFIPYMHSVLAKYNLPNDLVYLSMMESGFNTRAMSWAAAGGLWQFIKSTGALYGLNVDYYVDERADVEKATDAAARHLRDLYNEFGDWYLAFAAYNAGAGKVRNAINRHGRNFWDMAAGSYLRQETKDYVPKIIAAAIISKNPAKYGFRNVEYQLPIDYEKVRLQSVTDLEVAAECSGVNPDLIRLLNPELMRDMSPPYMPNYLLKIPRGTKARFEQRYASLSPSQRIKVIEYVAKDGDTVGRIANNYGISERDLISENSGKIKVYKEKKSRVEKVKNRKGRYVRKKASYTVAYYSIKPGTRLTIPKNRSVAKNASSRDDAAALAAQSRFGLKIAQNESGEESGKKNKKHKKKEKETPPVAEEEAPILTEASDTISNDEALTPKREVKSDLDPSLWNGNPEAPKEEKSLSGQVASASSSASVENPEANNEAKLDSENSPSASAETASAQGLQEINGTPPSNNDLQEAVDSVKAEAPNDLPTKATTQTSPVAPAATPKVVEQNQYYTVKRGDSLARIAFAYKTTMTNLKTWNGDKVFPVLKSGTRIIVGKNNASDSKIETKTVEKKSKSIATTSKNTPYNRYHLVRSGDTLGKIASKYGVSSNDLKKWNGKKVLPHLKVGTKIIVARENVIRYKVKPGDNLIAIARKHDTTADKIQELNDLKNSTIVPGAVLIVQSPR